VFTALAILFLMVSPHVAVADDKTSDKANSNSSSDAAPAKTNAPTKINAPAPLTDRERWLLDRVEQLERRVADLESESMAGMPHQRTRRILRHPRRRPILRRQLTYPR